MATEVAKYNVISKVVFVSNVLYCKYRMFH